MSTFIANVGENLALYKVHVDEIKEQDVNARVMPPEMLERLTETVKRENRLEQLPFTAQRDHGFELISGHHRLRAARSAGLTEIFILADTRDLPRSKVVAKQLAHNRISGEDDKQILARLYAEIEAVEDILESYVRPSDFDDIRQLAPSDITNMSLMIEWRQLSLVFLPKVMQQLDRIDAWVKKIPREADEIGVVSTEVFERFRTSALAVSKAENVRALGAVVGKMLDIVEEWCKANDIDLNATSAEDAAEAKALMESDDAGKPGKASGKGKSHKNGAQSRPETSSAEDADDETETPPA